jgi:hypothetical protein
MLGKLRERFFHKSAGIDGILVTMGLCIIALVLCVLMKEELKELISFIVNNMQTKAEGILGENPAKTTGIIFFGGPWIW